jgi:hypothetical protein
MLTIQQRFVACLTGDVHMLTAPFGRSQGAVLVARKLRECILRDRLSECYWDACHSAVMATRSWVRDTVQGGLKTPNIPHVEAIIGVGFSMARDENAQECGGSFFMVEGFRYAADEDGQYRSDRLPVVPESSRERDSGVWIPGL